MSTTALAAPIQSAGTSILQKLLAVMKDCGYIQKDKKNTFHGYSYASEAAIKDRVHSALVEHGVIQQISLLGLTEREISRVNAKGQQVSEWLTTANVHYKFYCCDTGEFIEGTFYGCGIDPSDKGLYKAITGAIKYLLTSQFLIPTGDDPENDDGRTASKEEKKGKQEDYLRSRGIEPKPAPVPKQSFYQPPPGSSPTSASTIRELDTMLNAPPSPKTIEMRHAAEAEADAALKEVKKPVEKQRKTGAVTFDVLKHFGEIKKLLNEATGSDEAYYATLKAYSYQKSNEIKDNDQAREIYKALAGLHKRAQEDKKLRTELELAHMQYGVDFIDLLGVHACTSIDDVLLLSSDPLQALLAEIKDLGKQS